MSRNCRRPTTAFSQGSFVVRMALLMLLLASASTFSNTASNSACFPLKWW
jgi:hypothetical protein